MRDVVVEIDKEFYDHNSVENPLIRGIREINGVLYEICLVAASNLWTADRKAFDLARGAIAGHTNGINIVTCKKKNSKEVKDISFYSGTRYDFQKDWQRLPFLPRQVLIEGVLERNNEKYYSHHQKLKDLLEEKEVGDEIMLISNATYEDDMESARICREGCERSARRRSSR